MGNIKKDTFICLDCETTGLDVENDEIIELAIAKFTYDEILDKFETLIDPKRPISQESIEIHKITDEMVSGKPKIEEILHKTLEMINGYTIVGHNIGFDISMLIQASKKRGIPFSIDLKNSIDTLRLARLYADSPSNSLEVLRKHFNIEDEGAHRAMSDVIVNIKVFKYLIGDFKTTEEIRKRLIDPIELKTMPLGKYKGRILRDVPSDYLNWASHQNFDMDLSYTILKERRKRRSHPPFSGSSNPFADL